MLFGPWNNLRAANLQLLAGNELIGSIADMMVGVPRIFISELRRVSMSDSTG